MTVLDASAVLAFLQGEDGPDVVAEALADGGLRHPWRASSVAPRAPFGQTLIPICSFPDGTKAVFHEPHPTSETGRATVRQVMNLLKRMGIEP